MLYDLTPCPSTLQVTLQVSTFVISAIPVTILTSSPTNLSSLDLTQAYWPSRQIHSSPRAFVQEFAVPLAWNTLPLAIHMAPLLLSSFLLLLSKAIPDQSVRFLITPSPSPPHKHKFYSPFLIYFSS